MGSACGISLPFLSSSDLLAEPVSQIKPKRDPLPPIEFADIAEAEAGLRTTETLTKLMVADIEEIYALAERTVSTAKDFLASLAASLEPESHMRSRSENRSSISSVEEIRETVEHKRWTLRNHLAEFRKGCSIVKSTASTRIVPTFMQVKARAAGFEKRVLLWKRQSSMDTQSLALQLNEIIEKLRDLGLKLAYALMLPQESELLTGFRVWEQKLFDLCFVETPQLYSGDGQEDNEEQTPEQVYEEIVEEGVEEHWEEQDFQEMIVACEAPQSPASIGSPFSLPELPDVEDGHRSSTKTTISDVTPTLKKAHTATLCLPFDVRTLLHHKEMRAHPQLTDPKFEHALEVGSLYSERGELAQECAANELRIACKSLQLEGSSTPEVCQLFTEIMITKAREDEENMYEGNLPEGLGKFVFRNCENIMGKLLSSLQQAIREGDSTCNTIARILNVFVVNPFPASVSLVIPRLFKFLPEASLPSSQRPGGRLKLSDAVYFISKVFANTPGHGIDLIRRIRPSTLSPCDLTLFLICFKMKITKQDSLFQQIADGKDKAPLQQVSLFLREKLELWSSEEEVEEALSSLDAKQKGLVTRMAFTRSLSENRFRKLARLPEYSIETMDFVREFAEGCVRRRREVVSKLAIVYRVVAGDNSLSVTGFRRLLEAVSPSNVTNLFPALEQRDEYTFQHFLNAAEKWLLGPFKSVYLIAQSNSRELSEAL